jgi:hypothetical protein
MTSDNTWDSVTFVPDENLDELAWNWLSKRCQNPAFQSGLVSRMQQMVSMKLITASVDIIDLL